MSGKPKVTEILNRLQRAKDHFGGELPQDAAAAWDGYFAALIEWDLISIEDHRQLVEMLPETPQGEYPVLGILLGYGDVENEGSQNKESHGVRVAWGQSSHYNIILVIFFQIC